MTNLCYEHVGEQMQWLYTRVKSDSAISAKMLETAAPEFTLQNTSSTVWEKGGRIDACRVRCTGDVEARALAVLKYDA